MQKTIMAWNTFFWQWNHTHTLWTVTWSIASLPVWWARQHIIAFLIWPAFGYNNTSQNQTLGFLWCPSRILCISHISVFIFFTVSLWEGVRGGIHWGVHGNCLSQGYKARYAVQIEPRVSPSPPRPLLVGRVVTKLKKILIEEKRWISRTKLQWLWAEKWQGLATTWKGSGGFWRSILQEYFGPQNHLKLKSYRFFVVPLLTTKWSSLGMEFRNCTLPSTTDYSRAH